MVKYPRWVVIKGCSLIATDNLIITDNPCAYIAATSVCAGFLFAKKGYFVGRNSKIKDGDRFGNLTVIKRNGSRQKPSGKKDAIFLCRCDCGNLKDVRADYLSGGAGCCFYLDFRHFQPVRQLRSLLSGCFPVPAGTGQELYGAG